MPRTILVVDDNDDVRELMSFMLDVLNYTVIEATDGWQAYEIVQQNKPDLILMDISMPGTDGITATQLIRNMNGTEDLPIICVTGHSQRYMDKAYEAGVNDIIIKPVDFERLKGILESYIPSPN